MVICFHSSQANDNARLTRTISKQFPINAQSSFELQNSYGDVIVKGWDKDSISVTVTITAFGKDDPAAKRLLERTEIKFTKLGPVIRAVTELSKSNGWLRDFWNEMSGYSQTILSKDQLTIDYQVYIPEHVALEVDNKYGNIFLSDRSGNTKIDLSNGNFKAEELLGHVDLNFRFSDADIGRIADGDITLKSAELFLTQASEINIQSNSSTIQLDQVDKLRINSRTDKITLKDIKSIAGNASFTKIRIRALTGNLDLETNYGSLDVEQVAANFTECLVRGNSTDVDLRFDHMAHFNTRIIAKEGKFDLPANHGLRQVYTDGTEKFIKSTGSLGKPKSSPGEVDIEAQGGKVQIRFAPLDVHSSN